MTKINLNVDTTTNKVIANEGGKPKNQGNLCAPKNDKLKWQGKHVDGSGEFVVTFKNEETGVEPDWPFVEDPVDSSKNELRISATDGKEVRTVKPGLWKYSVEYTGAAGVTALDPMIIVRDSSGQFDGILGLGAAFVAGAIVAVLVLRARSSRTR